MPFSDPMADGPVIQAASEKALANGIGVTEVLAMAAAFRDQDPDTPVVLMGYLNPIHRYGASSFSTDAAAADRNRATNAELEAIDGNPLVMLFDLAIAIDLAKFHQNHLLLLIVLLICCFCVELRRITLYPKAAWKRV